MTHRNLASERVRIGLTQQEMADILGCNIRTLWRYETGAAAPPIDLIAKAADHFGCTVDYLLDRTEERVGTT